MAGNASDWRGREYQDRERDRRRGPVRVASKERDWPVGGAAAVADVAAGSGRAFENRDSTANAHRTHSPTHNRARSISQDRYRGHTAGSRRQQSPDSRRAHYRDSDSSKVENPGVTQDSSNKPEHHRQPAPKRQHARSPSPTRPHTSDSKRRRSRSRTRAVSPARSTAQSHRPGRDARPSHRASPSAYHRSTRHRSRSVDSRYRQQSSKYSRRPSPEDRARVKEYPKSRYRSPPRPDRRRYSPPPSSRRSYRDQPYPAYPPRHHDEDYYGTRHSKPAARSPSRDNRRSPSPSDLISQLADGRREETGHSRRRPDPHSARRSSRSPPPDRSRREYPDESRYRGRERDRGFDSARRDYHEYSPRRERGREEDEGMYGRGGYPRGPPGRPPYVDPRYAQHSPPYAQPPPVGMSPPHAHSPYGRGGYAPPPQAYGSYHGSPVHGYSPQQSPYHYPPQGYYPPPGASPYHQPPPQAAGHYGPPQVHQPYPPQQAYPPPQQTRPPRNGSYGPPPIQGRSGPPPGAGRGRAGHYANLSWTPTTGSRGGKITNNGSTRATSSSGAVTPAGNAGTGSASIDDDDNPFRPPKDLRAEDETSRGENKSAGKPGISFSIKGMAEKKNEPPPPPQMKKQLVIRKRLKEKPRLTGELASSDSVYYRKVGNESVIGSGTYGKVYKAIHVYTKDEVALKKIRMEGERDGFPVTAIREIKLLQSLSHSNVVKLHEVMVERNDCFMVFEYLSHDLTGLLNHPSFTLTPAHKKHLAQQLFEGLDYLHKRSVLHRDIKAANILVSRDGELKLADFGLARFYNKSAKKKQDYTNRVITIWYRSPELLLGETQYGPSVDVWSAACVLVEIFTRHAIFPGDGGEINQLDKIYNVLGTPSRQEWPGITELAWYELLRPTQRLPSTFEEKYKERVSPAAFELLSAMFQYDPVARPSASDVLEHPYFTTEEPKAQRAWGLKDLEGDWHEFESKALRKEKEREARRKDREVAAEKRKPDATVVIDERETKRSKAADVPA